MPIDQLAPEPPLIDQVHDRLLAAVVDGELVPGERLTQERIALMLGVSRQPVSHALQMLKRRGLFVEAGRRGVAVAPIDARRIRDLYQVRAALDGLAAELAARRLRTGGGEARADLAALRTALEHGDRQLGSGDLSTLVVADVEFHSALYRLSGNPVIVDTVAEQWPHFRRSMRRVLETAAPAGNGGSDEPIARRVWREHAAIFEAIVLNRASDAAALAREHALRAAESTAKRLEASP